MSLSSKSGASKKGKAVTGQYKINLALQGGGAHGAFTWGVLDRLLEEEDVDIVAISGTSAGAMNAALVVDGMHEGGRALAKEKLKKFWWEISVAAATFAPFSQQPPIDMFPGMERMEWLSAFNPADMITRLFSPYELNPSNFNPMKDILGTLLTCENLNNGTKLFVTATNVETGQPRIFHSHEITLDVLMASATLPFIYQAVEIDGAPFWDGGYAGNPAIYPLIYKTTCADVLLVQINPLQRLGVPKHAIDIINRLNEISFNSSLIAEMRAINFVKKLIHSGKLSADEYTDVRMHMVMPPETLHQMNASTKMYANWNFFETLHGAGRDEMDGWLRKHKKALGKHSTVDIEKVFLAKTHRMGEDDIHTRTGEAIRKAAGNGRKA